jgi:hypothetical protein
MRWNGHVARIGEMRNAYNILSGKTEGKSSLARPMCRWEDIIMDLKKTCWKRVEWLHLVRDTDQWQAFVNTVMNFRFP